MDVRVVVVVILLLSSRFEFKVDFIAAELAVVTPPSGSVPATTRYTVPAALAARSAVRYFI